MATTTEYIAVYPIVHLNSKNYDRGDTVTGLTAEQEEKLLALKAIELPDGDPKPTGVYGVGVLDALRLDENIKTLTAQLAQNAKKTENIINPLTAPYNAKGDGTDESGIFTSILSAIGSTKKTILIPTSFRFSQNIIFPENVALLFVNGGVFNVDSTIIITIKGEIQAGNYQIFSGLGTIDKSSSTSPYNVGWYEGVSLNKKWDKMQVNFNDMLPKTIIIPKPYPNQVGAIRPNPIRERWYWLLDATLQINDYNSLSTMKFEGELYASTNIGTGVVFGLTATKLESVHLPYGLSVSADSTNRLTIGVEVRSIARLYVSGRFDINNADKPLVIGGANQAGNVSQITIEAFHCGYAKDTGVEVYGKGGGLSLDNVRFNHTLVENNLITGKDAIVVKGKINTIEFQDIFYNINLGQTCRDVFVVQSTTEGSPFSVRAKNVYGNNISGYGLRTEDLSGATATQIENLLVENIHVIGTTQGATLGYTKSATVNNLSGGLSVTIGSNCQYTRLNATNRLRSITNSGNQSVINGVGEHAYGVGSIPLTTDWAQGNIVNNKSDNTVWLKYRNTGVTADDFIKLN